VTNYQNAAGDIDCESAGTTVFIGNVGLSDFQEPRADVANPATAILSIDVISTPGSQAWTFHFVTLLLQIETPAKVMFVNHSGRGNYHREVLADPAVGITDASYWSESDDASRTLRIREDETALLSSDGNGRTYHVGVAGVSTDTEALRFTAIAAGSLVRETSCHLVIDELRAGDRIAGYLG
jgi:hypothetical protein